MLSEKNGKNFLATRGLIGGLFDDSEEKTMEQLAANQDLFNRISLPDFKDYTPEELQYLGDWNPESAQANQISEDPMLRSAQLSHLAKLSGLADTGLSDVDAAAYAKARELGSQQARAGTEAALQNAAARGVSGSGMEMAMREIANQEGARRSQDAGLAQAANAAQQRALYQQAYGNAVSGVRNQDLNVNSQNADILNRFNMANTNTRNQAGLRNIETKQGLSNQNVGERNNAQQYNNQLQAQRFQSAMAKAGGQAGANTGMAQGYAAQNASRGAARQQDFSNFMKIMSMAGGGGGGMGGMGGGG